MVYEQDRRSSERQPADCGIYFFGEGSNGTWQLRGEVSDVSKLGLAFHSQHKWDIGTILWCAVPSKAIYTRAMVCHCTGRPWDRTTGVRFLAGPQVRD